MTIPEAESLWLVGGVLTILAVATLVGQLLSRRVDVGLNPAIVAQFHRRVRVWWLNCSVLAVAFFLGAGWTVTLFGLVSFWALREFITLTPTRRGDHRALFWVFFVITPLQYVLVGMDRWNEKTDLHEAYAILIPVGAFLFILARVALAGDYKRFFERTAKIQAGLMICVYCLSYAPALLTYPLDVPGPKPEDARIPLTPDEKARLLFFFVLVVQLGDVMQDVWDKLVGRRVIAEEINPTKTWEGFFGGVASATLLGTLLWWATPFRFWEAALLSALISAIGFAGGLTMSAIKRDRGVRDYGTLIEGHVGILDRLDSICFAAPVFFQPLPDTVLVSSADPQRYVALDDFVSDVDDTQASLKVQPKTC